MKIGKKKLGELQAELGPGTGIDASNYIERGRAFVSLRGGVGFVIRGVEGQNGSRLTKQPATEPQWIAWLRYFEAKDIAHSFAVANGAATVPCEWPENFDAEAPTSDRLAVIERGPPASFDYARRALGITAALTRKLEAIGKPEPRRREASAVMAEDALREYGAQPLAVSDRMRRLLGLRLEEPAPVEDVEF